MNRLWLRAVFVIIVSGFAAPALAQSVMKQCSEAYQAAKAANQLNGETWPQFLSHCSLGKSAKTEAVPKVEAPPAVNAVPAVSAAPVVNVPPPAVSSAVVAPTVPPAMPGAVSASSAAPVTPAVTPPSDPAAPTPQATPATSRQKLCGIEWRANKDTLKVQYGTWPKFWSACNLRMKSTGK